MLMDKSLNPLGTTIRHTSASGSAVLEFNDRLNDASFVIMLALPVEKSREQRQQRLQARFRDRGGIFVPSEKNALIDILLARCVTGESLSKRVRPRTQQGSSPVREIGDGKTLAADGGQVAAAPDTASLANGKAIGQTKRSRKLSKEPSGKAPKADHDDASDNGSPAIGPNNNVEVMMKSARLGKGKARSEVIVVPSDESHAPKRTKRLPKATNRPKDCHADDDNNDREDNPVRLAPKRRGRPLKSKPQSQPSIAETLDDIVRAEEPVKSKRVLKRRLYAADSDREDDGASSDYTPTSRKRSSKQAALAKSAATAVRRKKPVRVTQPDDSDDSSAIIIVAKKKVIKADSGIVLFLLLLLRFSPLFEVLNSVYPKKPFSDSRISDDGNDSPPKPKPKPRQRAKPHTLKKSLYLDDDDDDHSETIQVNLPAHTNHDVKVKANRAPAAVEDKQDAAAKFKCRTRSTKPSKTVAAPDTDGEESQVEPNHLPKVKIKSSASQIKVKHTDAQDSSKRPRGVADVGEHEPDSEGSTTPPPTRKRAKIIASPISDDETLVEPTQSKAGSPKVAKGKSPEIAKNSSRTLKGNAIALKGKSASQKTKQIQPKPSRVIARKGPPQEVLSRIKARPPSSPPADSDTDPIDFLS
ncbi:hypothetical protein PILCRDRAFT_204733 [Piloderma croceum F 1598]|uniref:Uncharacterized protein n=1 Tax=Piloderma croceum (strain F 1598) TaxID=765440 RepID=A0A0C3GHA8_PILCF|nr:hypothetical protein PILCRDRAFT_204733 [Piloderma croceum F 1598]